MACSKIHLAHTSEPRLWKNSVRTPVMSWSLKSQDPLIDVLVPSPFSPQLALVSLLSAWVRRITRALKDGSVGHRARERLSSGRPQTSEDDSTMVEEERWRRNEWRFRAGPASEAGTWAHCTRGGP